MRAVQNAGGPQRQRSLLNVRLKQNAVFSALPEETRNRIASEATLRTFGRGEVIDRELSSPGHLVLLLEGGVEICRRTDEGSRVVFRILHPPAALGFLLLSRQPHTADVVAAESVLVALLPVATLRGLFEANPQLLYSVITRLAELVDALSGEIVEQRTLSLTERVRIGILRNADQRGELHLSHDELAELVGSTRANVTRALKRLAEDGQIQLERRLIRIAAG